RSDRPNRILRSRIVNFNQWRAWNFDGDRLSGGENINAHAVFVNNWETGAGYTWTPGGFDDRATRGGPSVRVNASHTFWHYVGSARRRPIALNYFGAYGGDSSGSRFRELVPELTYRPVPAVMTSLGVRIFLNRDDSQWVDKVTDTTDHFVFAHLEQTTVSLTGR